MTDLPLTIKKICSELESGKLRIPDFQRGEVWDANQIETLLDSIYRRYPIGSFLMWTTSESILERNPLNLKLPKRTPKSEIHYLLDGQQRAIALYNVFKGTLTAGGKKTEYGAYFDLDKQQFSLVKKRDIEKGRVNIGDHQVSLNETIILDTKKETMMVNSKLWIKFGGNQKILDVLSKLQDAFCLSTPVIGIYEDTSLLNACEIFERMNTQGTPLTIVDIMVAKTYSSKPFFNLREEIERINSTLDTNGFGLHSLTILECASACLTGGISRQDIISSVGQDLKKNWKKCMGAFNKSVDFLNQRGIVPVSKFIPNEVILAPLSYFFYNEKHPTSKQFNELEKFFWKASTSQRYIEGQNAKIKDDIRLMKYFVENKKLPSAEFKWLADFEAPSEDELIEQNLSFTSALSKSVLCLYSVSKPRDFGTNQEIDLIQSFSNANTRQLHHIFPKNYLKTKYGKRYETKIKSYENSVINICLLSALSNKSIRDKSPRNYLSAFRKRNRKIKETLKTHLIYGKAYSAMKKDDFDSFIKERSKIVIKELHEKSPPHF